MEYRNPLMYYIFLTYSYFGEEKGGVGVIAGGSGGGAAVMASGTRGTDRLREGTGLSAGDRSEWVGPGMRAELAARTSFAPMGAVGWHLPSINGATRARVGWRLPSVKGGCGAW